MKNQKLINEMLKFSNKEQKEYILNERGDFDLYIEKLLNEAEIEELEITELKECIEDNFDFGMCFDPTEGRIMSFIYRIL